MKIRLEHEGNGRKCRLHSVLSLVKMSPYGMLPDVSGRERHGASVDFARLFSHFGVGTGPFRAGTGPTMLHGSWDRRPSRPTTNRAVMPQRHLDITFWVCPEGRMGRYVTVTELEVRAPP